MLVAERKKREKKWLQYRKKGGGRNIFFKVFNVLIVYCVTS